MSRARIRHMGPLALLAAALVALPGASRAAPPKEASTELKARLSKVEQLIGDWDIAGAKQELEALAKKMPKDAEPLRYFQGRVAFEEGRYADAVEALTAAGIPDKEGSYLRLAKETLKVTEGHQRIESEHFIFLYPPGKDELLAPYALETLEAQRDALQKDLGYAPSGKIRVEVVNDARELAKISTLTYAQIRNTGTIAICKFSKLMVTSPKAVLRGYDWQDTLAHEFVHLVVTETSRNSVPIWLHEGLAKYLESRWRGAPGQAISPSTLALLGRRVNEKKLIPFEKMHPSIALLPTAEDAATAFAEVFFAIDLLYRERGTEGLRLLLSELKSGKEDKEAVEIASGRSFAAFEKAWHAHLKKQPFPKEFLPTEKVVLKEQPGSKSSPAINNREISFGEFADMHETEAKHFAHLGELFRERNRSGAAVAEFAKAHRLVGDKYEALSNKYALALMEERRVDEAEKVLLGSLRLYPSSASTKVHLGRIYLSRNEYEKAKASYLEALSSDPFDPEIHLALLHAYEALGDKPRAEREKKAAALLTSLSPKEVEAIAAGMGKGISDEMAPRPSR